MLLRMANHNSSTRSLNYFFASCEIIFCGINVLVFPYGRWRIFHLMSTQLCYKFFSLALTLLPLLFRTTILFRTTTNNIQDEKLTGDDFSVMPMYNVSGCKDSPTVYATLTPTDDNTSFKDWVDGDGRNYLSIDATTREGLQQVATFNNITRDDEFWTKSVETIYFDLFWNVQMQGVKDGWTCCAFEGMHRYTSTLSYYLCGLPNRDTGYLTLASIKESDFTEKNIGQSKGVPDDKFFKSWIQEVFYTKTNKEYLKNLPLTVRFIKGMDLDAGEFSWSSRAYSQSQMVGKKESCNRSPFDIIGDIMGNDIKSMTIDQASRRADFTGIGSPTYGFEATPKVNATLVDFNNDAEAAYPWTQLYDTAAYQAFIINPLDDTIQNTVKNEVLCFTPKGSCTHMLIGNAKTELQDPDSSVKLSPPFLPSYLSMASDVGKNFDRESFMNPDIANGAYYGPIIITYLYALYNNTLVHRVIDKPERIKLTRFFLRFVNNANDNNTMMQVHGAWKVLLGPDPPNYFWDCSGIEVVIGCTQVILSFFNSLLSTAMETVADKVWEDRRQMLNSIGVRFSTLLEKISPQTPDITGQNQLKALGT